MPLDAGSLPGWISRSMKAEGPWTGTSSGIEVRCVAGDPFDLVSVRAVDALDIDGEKLRSLASDMYDLLRTTCDGRQPIRIWNHMPFITSPVRPGFDRYMAFNEGRHDAMVRWFGTKLDGRLPTATGVGHRGSSLVVHLLVGDVACAPIENPRQRPAVRYSDRFGPKPPCFSRAGLLELDDRSMLLIAGTASVRGEDSVHHDDFEGQLAETLENLEALIDSCHPEGDPTSALDSVRVYCTDGVCDQSVTAIRSTFSTCDVEFVRADLCRRELLVEIEGVASWRRA